MEKPDDDKILSSLDEGSSRGGKKKHLTETLRAENEIDEEIQSDSDLSDSGDSSDSSDSSDSDEYECTVCEKTFSGYIPFKQHEKGSKHKKTLARKKKMEKIKNKGSGDDEDEEDQEPFIQEPFAVCETCAKQFSGPESYTLHQKSKAHKKKKLEASILQQVKENGEINVGKLKELYIQKKSALGKSPVNLDKAKAEEAAEGYDDLDAGEYECKTCEKVFSGLVPFTQHLVSKTHAKQLEKTKLMRKVVPEPSGKVSDISDVSVLGIEDDILVCKACSTSFSGPENAISHLKSQNHKKKLAKYLRKLEKKKNKAIELEELTVGSGSKRNEEAIHEELEDNSSEESDEPTRNLSEEPEGPEKLGSEAKLDEGNTHKMSVKFEMYKKAMKSLQKSDDSE